MSPRWDSRTTYIGICYNARSTTRARASESALRYKRAPLFPWQRSFFLFFSLVTISLTCCYIVTSLHRYIATSRRLLNRSKNLLHCMWIGLFNTIVASLLTFLLLQDRTWRDLLHLEDRHRRSLLHSMRNLLIEGTLFRSLE